MTNTQYFFKTVFIMQDEKRLLGEIFGGMKDEF